MRMKLYQPTILAKSPDSAERKWGLYQAERSIERADGTVPNFRVRSRVDLKWRSLCNGAALSRHPAIAFLAITIFVALSNVAVADNLDQLAQDLAGNNQARVRARQLLPRYGVKALAPVVPLLAHEDPEVNHAAYNVVEDICNQAGAPGRTQDRLVATQTIMGLLAPEQPREMKLVALRLLPVLVPDGFDVGPIAALLSGDDADLREKARACLQHIGTREACKALLAALPKAEPEFTWALLEAIGHLQDPASVMPVGLTAASHEDPKVRAAALRAVAWTGDPSLAQTYRDVLAKATPETAFETTETMLLFTEAMAENGGNWDLAIALYKEILTSTDNPVLQSGALMGLGRFGDETVVDTIVKAAVDPPLQSAAVSAFEALRGQAAANRMAEAYPQCPPELRLLLVEMFGRKNNAAFLPILQAETKSDDPAFRMAALRALSDSAQFDALPVLVEAAQSGSEEEQAIAMEGAKRVARSLGSTGDPKAAGQAFVKLYNLAQSDDLRILALEGLARYPSADAHGIVLAALKNDALKDAASRALPALLAPIAAAGDEAKALEIFNLATQADPSPEAILRMASKLQGISTKLDTTRLLGVINFWHLVGPFDWKTDEDWTRPFVGEPNVDVTTPVTYGDKQLEWKPVTTQEATGLVDLIGNVAQRDRCFAYAYVEIEVPEAMPAQFRIGSDDGNALMLNGERIWENRIDRPAALDQDIVDCQLEQGVNKVLMKLNQGAGGWNFRARITRPDGTAVPFEIRRVQ